MRIMTGITKLEAHLLAGNEFKLKDKEGIMWDIMGCFERNFRLFAPGGAQFFEAVFADYDKIGTDYHIICHSLDKLTQPIMHEGKKIIGFNELGKIEGFFLDNLKYNLSCSEDKSVLGMHQGFFRFTYSKKHNCFGLWANELCTTVENQPALFAYMDSLHFDRFNWSERGLTTPK